MKNTEFIEILAKKLDLSVKHTKEITETFWMEIINVMKKDETGLVTPYGKFVLKKKPATPAREGINPITKEMMTFAAKPAKVVPQFKPGKKFKDEFADIKVKPVKK